ncbi:GDP-L-fucose synthase [Azorhizobium doebereinerae]|uniref:GDP-L-fucose synthase n=1 Tax=Azorhizobium doebereinerae TaxID=281091 RepID=UPI0004059634|nr:GDP-L-fucose synthase [Azorhizobium doebereinerae]
MFALRDKRIWVAGHRGMVGSALVRRLEREACTVLTASHAELDLRDQAATRAFVLANRPDAVILAAATVGGILANDSFPAHFLYNNMMIAANVVHAAYEAGVSKLLYLGSSCIYPKFAPQPIPEAALLTGELEPTNQWYAIAKIAGLKLTEAYRRQYGCDFIAAMPTNLYGRGDNFDLAAGHVLPALLRKAHEAKLAGAAEIVIWGTGTPRREFLHVDDCAEACIHLMQHYSDFGHVNVGSGEDVTILELTERVCAVVGFKGRIVNDLSKPDGTPRKLMAADKIRALGWGPRIGLDDGIRDAYHWFQHDLSQAARGAA